MGGQSSKNPTGLGYFSPEEVSHFKSVFHSISSGNNKTHMCTAGEFQRQCEKVLHDWLALKLTDAFSIKNPKGGENLINVPEVLKFLSQLFKGTLEEKVNCILRVELNDAVNKTVTRDEIAQYARCISESYLKCMENTPSFRSWKGSQRVAADAVSEFADFLLRDLLYEGISDKEIISSDATKTSYDVDELTKCFSKSPLLINMQSFVFSECFNFNKSLYSANLNLLPSCVLTKTQAELEDSTILDLTQILFINSQLPMELRDDWRCLFSTASDGESFSKMLGAILNKGSTVLIIKDNGGRIFGAFADESWSLGPKFVGSEKCFLFHLEPKLVAYNSTAFNQNYQYLNTQQQTMPNGLGFGGKLEYFGLWVDAEFGKGKCSPSCTTFSCPQLSKIQEFAIQAMEVWGVGPEPKAEEGQRDTKSVLDKDPEARAILELMNRGPVSEGEREKKKAYEEGDSD